MDMSIRNKMNSLGLTTGSECQSSPRCYQRMGILHLMAPRHCWRNWCQTDSADAKCLAREFGCQQMAGLRFPRVLVTHLRCQQTLAFGCPGVIGRSYLTQLPYLVPGK